jgi:hypothetical protein
VSAESSTASGGIGFTGLLTILFIALKLTGYITWSWWWVLSPLWIAALTTIAILVLILLGAVVVAIIAAARK